MFRAIAARWRKHNFLFEELVKRDFKKRYKRTVLGILWSMLNPLLQLFVMTLVFGVFFAGDQPHYTVFVFSGLLVFNFFSESTTQGMSSLVANSGIYAKVRVPKYLFLLSQNVSSLLNFGITLAVFFAFALLDGIAFGPRFLLLVYPVLTLTAFNIGMGLVLSALFVFFKDVQYLYGILTRLIMWMSAIFYNVEAFSQTAQRLFLLNPVFAHIHYFRLVVLHGLVPAWHIHLVCAGYALGSLAVGAFFYRRYNYRFIYYA